MIIHYKSLNSDLLDQFEAIHIGLEKFQETMDDVRTSALNAQIKEDENRLLDIDGACDYLQINKDCLRKLQKGGFLTSIRRKRKKLFWVEDLLTMKNKL